MLENRISFYRKLRNLTQDQLAEAIGSTRNQLVKLEKGTRPLNSDWLERIAAVLEIEPYLLIAPMRVVEAEDRYASKPDISGILSTTYVINETVLSPAIWEIVQNSRNARTATDLRPLVRAFGLYLQSVLKRPSIHDNPDALEAIAQAIIPQDATARTQA